jgi:hypothetical protein
MAEYGVQYSNQGLRVTVNSFIHDPLLVRARLTRMVERQWIMEAILRNEGQNNSGVIQYEENAPNFLDDDPEVVAEGGEIPLGQGSEGTPKASFTIKTALGLMITREMRDRNRVGTLNRRMIQLRNTFLRHWELRMFAEFSGKAVNVQPVTTAWATSTTLRDDISAAIETVTEATLGVDDDDQDFMGFEPDTLLIPTGTKYDLIRNEAFGAMYEKGDMTPQHPMYRHSLERTVMGLQVMESRFLTPGTAYVMQKGEVGGYSDERPFNVGELYEDQNNETWRANAVRRTAIFIDQPKAYVKLTGV